MILTLLATAVPTSAAGWLEACLVCHMLLLHILDFVRTCFLIYLNLIYSISMIHSNPIN